MNQAAEAKTKSGGMGKVAKTMPVQQGHAANAQGKAISTGPSSE